MQTKVAPVIGIIAALGTVGCVHPYEQPSVSAPHAVVKLRLAYHDHPARQLAEKVLLNEFDVVLPPDETLRANPATEAMRIRPESAAFRIVSRFYHTYTTTSMQTTSYACGASTCTRTTPVTTTHTVTDGFCEQKLTFSPTAGEIYLLQYDFLGADQCTLACLRQIPGAGDQFTTESCRLLPNPAD